MAEVVGKIMAEKLDKTILGQFSKLIFDNFSEFLKQYGFQYIRKRIEKYFCEIIYAKQKLYISFEANIHPRDYPPYFNILLGEGSIGWPDYDWNNIALWHFIKQTKEKNSIQEYSLEDSSKLEKNLERAKRDLIKYGRSFLNGDLSYFYQIRKGLNKDREPYRISTKNKDGSYSEKYDKESIKLKEKYSS